MVMQCKRHQGKSTDGSILPGEHSVPTLITRPSSHSKSQQKNKSPHGVTEAFVITWKCHAHWIFFLILEQSKLLKMLLLDRRYFLSCIYYLAEASLVFSHILLVSPFWNFLTSLLNHLSNYSFFNCFTQTSSESVFLLYMLNHLLSDTFSLYLCSQVSATDDKDHHHYLLAHFGDALRNSPDTSRKDNPSRQIPCSHSTSNNSRYD